MSGSENSDTTNEEQCEERKDESAMSSHDSSDLEEKKQLEIIEYNSADDVSTEKDQVKEGGSWQCLSELPSIQTMTTFLLNTCHNYRQTMKAVLSGRHQTNHEDVGKCDGDAEIINDTIKTENEKDKERETESSAMEEGEKEECGPSKAVRPASMPRKRGRPPKAGSSKRFKRNRCNTISDIYQGKLCNLTHTRSRRRSDSEDDGDCIYS